MANDNFALGIGVVAGLGYLFTRMKDDKEEFREEEWSPRFYRKRKALKKARKQIHDAEMVYRKYKGRKGPALSATSVKRGTRRRGNDGNMWEVRKSGKSQRWFKGAESFEADGGGEKLYKDKMTKEEMRKFINWLWENDNQVEHDNQGQVMIYTGYKELWTKDSNDKWTFDGYALMDYCPKCEKIHPDLLYWENQGLPHPMCVDNDEPLNAESFDAENKLCQRCGVEYAEAIKPMSLCRDCYIYHAESFDAEKIPMPKLVGWEESDEVGGHYGALGRPIITVQHTIVGPKGDKTVEEVTYEANSKRVKTVRNAESFEAESSDDEVYEVILGSPVVPNIDIKTQTWDGKPPRAYLNSTRKHHSGSTNIDCPCCGRQLYTDFFEGDLSCHKYGHPYYGEFEVVNNQEGQDAESFDADEGDEI